MKQVFICDFRESGFLDWDFSEWFTLQAQCNESSWFGGGGTGTRGEVMISANVFERNGDNVIAFDPAAMNKNGRVIFYSDDVRESGQYLNLSNMPIYGPQTFTGNPLYISFTIQELDTEENKKIQAMLASLADMGGKAYPPSAPILGVLNTLGGVMLSSDTDDTEFRYHAVFDPERGHDKVNVPVLLPGDYVFIRKDKRLEPIDWENIAFNRKTGRLQRCIPTQSKVKGQELKSNEAHKCKDYIESTYFTLSINTYQKTFALDAAQSLGDFLQKNETYNVEQIDEFIAASKNLGATLEQIKTYDEIRTSLNRIDKYNDASEKKNEALKFSTLLCESVNSELNASPTMPSNLLHGQLNYLLSNLITRYKVNPEKVTRVSISEKCNSSGNANALMNDLSIVR